MVQMSVQRANAEGCTGQVGLPAFLTHRAFRRHASSPFNTSPALTPRP